MNSDDPKDYNNLPNDPLVKNPVEEGDVLHQNDDTNTSGLGQAQDINDVPDSPLVDGNIEEFNNSIEDTSEEE